MTRICVYLVVCVARLYVAASVSARNLLRALRRLSNRLGVPIIVIRGRVFTGERRGRKYVLVGAVEGMPYVGTGASFIVDGPIAYTIRRIPEFKVRGRKRLRFIPKVVEVEPSAIIM